MPRIGQKGQTHVVTALHEDEPTTRHQGPFRGHLACLVSGDRLPREHIRRLRELWLVLLGVCGSGQNTDQQGGECDAMEHGESSLLGLFLDRQAVLLESQANLSLFVSYHFFNSSTWASCDSRADEIGHDVGALSLPVF